MTDMKQLLILSLILVSVSYQLAGQKRITIDDMCKRYAEFKAGVAIDSTLDSVSDEIVRSYHNYFEKLEEKEVSFNLERHDDNPRKKSPKNYNYELTSFLRTEFFPDKRHFWSVVNYFPKEPGIFIDPKKAKKYFALDSIAGMCRDEWPEELKKKYCQKKGTFHYARGITDTLYMIGAPVNMLGYKVSPDFRYLIVKKGRVKNYYHSFDKCRNQRGLLWDEGPMQLDGGRRAHIVNRSVGFRDYINPLLDIVDPTAPPATYEILLIMNDDGSADIELLDCDREVGPEFQTLRRAIAKLPKQFFIRLWTIDEYPLPGAYMTGLYKEGKWRFNSFKYLLKY